ncbi:MAG: PAS domain-containing protein [Desulfosarcinaceae bacterium]|nr:PAS domain-containing protein [Desulfosarcinaceae bacterium]
MFKWRLVHTDKLAEMAARIATLEQEVHTARQHKSALRQNMRLLDVLLNTIPDPVFFQDVDGVLQGCNLSFADNVVGHPRGKILGKPLSELQTRSRRRLPGDLFKPLNTTSASAEVVQTEVALKCADDREHAFIVSKAAITASDGEVSGAVGLMLDITDRKRSEAEKEGLIKELKAALATVKTLRGLLPVCSFCKKIRNDQGYWQQLEAYIQEHSEAVFSHSICRECAKIHYPELNFGGG